MSEGTNGLAIAALISGILAWFICPFAGGVITIQMARAAQREVRLSGEGGAQLAAVASVLGWTNVVVAGLPMAIFAAFALFRLMHS